MPNKHNEVDHDQAQFHSRRRFFTWAGQVVAGLSLAGFGLNLTKPLEAFASSKQKVSKHSHISEIPNCNECPCNGCSDYVCWCNASQCGSGKAKIKVVYEGGCVNPGTPCPANYYVCWLLLGINRWFARIERHELKLAFT